MREVGGAPIDAGAVIGELPGSLIVLVNKCKSAIRFGQHVSGFAGAGAPINVFVHERRPTAPALHLFLPLVSCVEDT